MFQGFFVSIIKKLNRRVQHFLILSPIFPSTNKNVTVNLLIIDVLQDLYFESSPINYEEALNKLIEETKEFSNNTVFSLLDLPYFSEMGVAKVDNRVIKSASIRARLSKVFNETVREGIEPDVKKAVTNEGELKFKSRAAVYVIERL